MSRAPAPQSLEDGFVQERPQGQDTKSLAFTFEDGTNDLTLTQSSGYEIDVYRAGVGGDRQLVLSQGKAPAYFVRTSIFRPGVPDVTIFAGSDKNGAVIGVRNYTALSTTVFVCHG